MAYHSGHRIPLSTFEGSCCVVLLYQNADEGWHIILLKPQVQLDSVKYHILSVGEKNANIFKVVKLQPSWLTHVYSCFQSNIQPHSVPL